MVYTYSVAFLSANLKSKRYTYDNTSLNQKVMKFHTLSPKGGKILKEQNV